MPGGDAFSPAERHEIDKAIRDAETLSRLEFSVYVGRTDGDPREFAERCHASLVAPSRSVLVLVDPAEKVLEIVTGSDAHRVLADADAQLAALTMQTAFAEGDLVGGITRGVLQLASHVEQAQVRHAGQ